MRKTLRAYCAEVGDDRLLKQWVSEKNVGLTPETVTIGSHNRVWWRCEKGHEWQAAVYTRAGGGAGCPVCAGKVVKRGFNDLATNYPELAAQWHPDKNGSLTPDDVLPASHKKVWWLCPKGHEWQAQLNSRSSGSGCPVCSNRQLVSGKNDLATLHPELAAQWHPEKNGSRKPDKVVTGSHIKVWWRCEKGHEWQSAVYARVTNGNDCPYCTHRRVLPGENDLASSYPAVARQWNEQKNGSISPQTIAAYSNRKVWWTCDKGHEYSAAVSARTMNGSGCPYCTGRKVLKGFNDLATVHPLIAAQWHEELNGRLTPEDVTSGSRKKVWWQCSDGHVWKAIIFSRTGPGKCGCPVCAGKVKKSTVKGSLV